MSTPPTSKNAGDDSGGGNNRQGGEIGRAERVTREVVIFIITGSIIFIGTVLRLGSSVIRGLVAGLSAVNTEGLYALIDQAFDQNGPLGGFFNGITNAIVNNNPVIGAANAIATGGGGGGIPYPPPDPADIVIMDHIDGVTDRWYVITVGPRVGVFRGWTNTGPLVLGHAQSVYQRADSRQIAINLFNAALEEGTVRVL